MVAKKSKLKKFMRSIVGIEEKDKDKKKSKPKPKPKSKPKKTTKPKKPAQKPKASKKTSSSKKPKKPTSKKPKPKPKPQPKSKPKKTTKPKKPKTPSKKTKKTSEKKPTKTIKPKPKPKKKYSFTIEEVTDFLDYEVSPELKEIISLLEKKDSLSENELAEKMNIKINGARKLLYILREWGFADYEKKSDEQKNWWFIYYWSIDKEKILKRYINAVKNEISKREELLKEESEYSFSCTECNLKYTYQEALENNFECKECGGVLQDLNNEIIIKKLHKETDKLNALLSRLKQDL